MLMLMKEDLKGVKLEIYKGAVVRVILSNGEKILVCLQDGRAFESDGHCLDDGNEEGEKAL